MQEFKDDRQFEKLLKSSKLMMPFSDFEENVMRRIETEIAYKKSVLKNLNLSMLFFILGIGTGTAVSLFLPKLISSLSGASSNEVLLVFQAFFVLIVLIQFDKLAKLAKKYGRA